jgi:hypothetical protein
MASGGRSSFDDAIRERIGALEQQRQLIAREAQRRLAEIERVAIEELEMLEHAASDKAAEIHWVAAEQRGAFERAVTTRSAELERIAREERAAFQEAVTSEVRRIHAQAAATRDDMRKTGAQEAAAFDELAGERLVELEGALRAQFEGLRGELVDQARRIQDTAVARLDHARSLVTSATDRIEQAAATTGDDSQRLADLQQAAFDKVRSQRALELQETVRDHIRLLDEARALAAGALRSGVEALGGDSAPPPAPEGARPVVAAAGSSPLVGAAVTSDEPEPSAIRWTAPSALPVPPQSPDGR